MKSYWNSTIANLNVITEIVDIIVKHLFLTVITPHRDTTRCDRLGVAVAIVWVLPLRSFGCCRCDRLGVGMILRQVQTSANPKIEPDAAKKQLLIKFQTSKQVSPTEKN